MRIRTWLAMALGVGVGAGSVYLLDPEHGRDRRREVAGRARRQAAARARQALVQGAGQARAVLVEARRGFAEERGVG